MAVIVKGTQFHLCNKNMSYIMNIFDKRYLVHSYWGGRLADDVDLSIENRIRYAMSCGAGGCVTTIAKAEDDRAHDEKQYYLNLSDTMMEFMPGGSGDYRIPTVEVEFADKSSMCEFELCDYKIIDGKLGLPGLPATYVEKEEEAQTLLLLFKDPKKGLAVELSYTVFEEYNAIARSIRYYNEGEEVKLLSAKSATVDFEGLDYKAYHLCGNWASERHIQCVPVTQSELRISSNRGIMNHVASPFLALAENNACEDYGNVYGFSLVYSGDFSFSVQGTSCGLTRFVGGINESGFAWTLKHGEEFVTPEIVMVYSGNGLGEMSRTYHRLYRNRLSRGKHRDEIRPLLVNIWEGTFFDFDEEKLLEIARKAKEATLDLFVVDDGWYADKDIGRKCKIGDWYEDKEKFPEGLSGTAQKINDLGLDFGLWIEPEMVGADSEIYQKHPDWIIHTKDRQRHIVHGRFVLDLAKEEVCQHIMDTFDRLLGEAPISYIKWDCNRSMVDRNSPMQAHQYILGLYKILEYLNTKYPELLIENCSAGGGRYDPGNMYYMHQAQISDNTYASDKIWMTYGTQLVYPASYITSKIGSDDYKGGRMELASAVGMSGIFGCEFDMSLLNTEDMDSLKETLAYYRSIQELVQKGEVYRISSPLESDIAAWQYVAENKKRAIVFVYRMRRAFSRWNDVLRLKGLDKKQVYDISICSDMTYRTKELEMSGQLLEMAGIRIAGSQRDFSYAIFELTAKESV